jgi:diaminopimelate epimerase
VTAHEFRKYQGLGNDFIVLDAARERLTPAVVERLCNRHYGIGADGVLLLQDPVSPGARGRMVVINADGSEPEMCGNGLRCVALELARRAGISRGEVVIDTGAGALACQVDGELVEVQMGQLKDEGAIDIPIGQDTHRFARLSIGNPHAVTFAPYDRAGIDRVGPHVATHPSFPRGTNVEFAALTPDGGIDLVVWERGVGRTLACGTGACATVGAACLARLRSFGETVKVNLPGGRLDVTVERGTLAVRMRGPAQLVFRGEVSLP